MAGVLTVVARIHPKAGRESEVEGLLVKMAAAVRQHEPDCLVYRRTGRPMSRRSSTSTSSTGRTRRSSSTGPLPISWGTAPR